MKSLVALLDSEAAHETYAAGILEYFRLEHLYETGQFQSLTRDRLIRLKRARRLFNGPDTESLFTLWKKDGDRAVSERIQDRGAFRFPISVDFRTFLLEHNYDFLETFSQALNRRLKGQDGSKTRLHQGFDADVDRGFRPADRVNPRDFQHVPETRRARLGAPRGRGVGGSDPGHWASRAPRPFLLPRRFGQGRSRPPHDRRTSILACPQR